MLKGKFKLWGLILINIKKSNPNLHDEILKKISDIAPNVPIVLVTNANKLVSLKIDDTKLSEGNKTKLKAYTDML